MLNWILERIEEYDSIVLFRHVLADMDALGSQLGLAYWLKETYPSKKIYCTGVSSPLSEKLDETMEEVSDEVLKESLGIILDTSNAARVDDQRYTMCKHTIRIDHHIKVETFCDEEWIDEKATATCEMLGLFFKSLDIKLPKKSAQLIYNGLIADSIRLSISTVRSESYDAAKYLYENGADVIETEKFNFSTTLKDYMYETIVRKSVKVSKNFVYAILEKEDYENAGLSFVDAKDKVYVLSGIEGITIWALFTAMEDGEHYSASLRSRTIPIRDVANDFGGGGHECASGIKNLTIDSVNQIIGILSKRS